MGLLHGPGIANTLFKGRKAQPTLVSLQIGGKQTTTGRRGCGVFSIVIIACLGANRWQVKLAKLKLKFGQKSDSRDLPKIRRTLWSELLSAISILGSSPPNIFMQSSPLSPL